MNRNSNNIFNIEVSPRVVFWPLSVLIALVVLSSLQTVDFNRLQKVASAELSTEAKKFQSKASEGLSEDQPQKKFISSQTDKIASGMVGNVR